MPSLVVFKGDGLCFPAPSPVNRKRWPALFVTRHLGTRPLQAHFWFRLHPRAQLGFGSLLDPADTQNKTQFIYHKGYIKNNHQLELNSYITKVPSETTINCTWQTIYSIFPQHSKLYNNHTNQKVHERNQFNVYQQGGYLFSNSQELLLLQSHPYYPTCPSKK